MEALAVERTRAAIQIAVEQRLLETMAVESAERDAALKRSEAFLLEAQRLSSTGSFSWRVATDEHIWSEQLYRIFEFEKSEPVTLPRVLVAHGTREKDVRLEYIGAVQDVTRRRIAEEALDRTRSELAHAVRVMSLGALTASIAHEVNQPLTGIITNAGTCLRMLTTEPPDIEGARETTRRTLRDGSRASEVITRLRALFGKKEVRTEQVDLNEATREVIALSLSELQRNRVTLRADLADDLPLVVGDRVQLQQVILNLFLNALDAMARVEEGSRVLTVRSEREEGDRVRLSVKDVRDVRPGPAAGADPARVPDSDHFCHRPERPAPADASARTGRGRVSVQTIQRHGDARSSHGRTA